jgi:hypothetical protein
LSHQNKNEYFRVFLFSLLRIVKESKDLFITHLKREEEEEKMVFILFTLFVAAFYWLYKKLTSNDADLEMQKIAHEKSLPIIGNILPLITKKEGIVQFIERYYNTHRNEK